VPILPKKQQHSRFPNRPDSDRPKRPTSNPDSTIDNDALGRSPKKATATLRQSINQSIENTQALASLSIQGCRESERARDKRRSPIQGKKKRTQVPARRQRGWICLTCVTCGRIRIGEVSMLPAVRFSTMSDMESKLNERVSPVGEREKVACLSTAEQSDLYNSQYPIPILLGVPCVFV
jgi:hypothetical protein